MIADKGSLCQWHRAIRAIHNDTAGDGPSSERRQSEIDCLLNCAIVVP